MIVLFVSTIRLQLANIESSKLINKDMDDYKKASQDINSVIDKSLMWQKNER